MTFIFIYYMCMSKRSTLSWILWKFHTYPAKVPHQTGIETNIPAGAFTGILYANYGQKQKQSFRPCQLKTIHFPFLKFLKSPKNDCKFCTISLVWEKPWNVLFNFKHLSLFLSVRLCQLGSVLFLLSGLFPFLSTMCHCGYKSDTCTQWCSATVTLKHDI